MHILVPYPKGSKVYGWWWLSCRSPLIQRSGIYALALGKYSSISLMRWWAIRTITCLIQCSRDYYYFFNIFNNDYTKVATPFGMRYPDRTISLSSKRIFPIVVGKTLIVKKIEFIFIIKKYSKLCTAYSLWRKLSDSGAHWELQKWWGYL